MIYFDNGATSYKKPKSVYKKIIYVMKKAGGNPGRSGHLMAKRASDEIFKTRVLVSEFFNIKNPQCVCFTNNATAGINFAIKGCLRENDHVIISAYEHNSVLRPVHKLSAKGITYSIAKDDRTETLEKLVKDNTKMIIFNHISNVCGNVADIKKIGEFARKKGIIFMVDASQSAGHIKIDVEENNIDILACAGHKSLFGMQGSGILYIKEGLQLDTLIEGGTGSMSLYKLQPDIMPDRFESGTLSTPAIAALGAGIEFINSVGIDKVHSHISEMSEFLYNGLKTIDSIKVYGDLETNLTSGVVGFNIGELDSEIISSLLSEEYSIMTRGGLHCSFLAHQSLGTLETGCVRVSLGFFNTLKECEKFLDTVDRVRLKVV